jgi:hypothetical protein
MKTQTGILAAVSLALIGGAAVLLLQLHSHQRLGKPAVKTSAIPGSARLQVDLPEFVVNWRSEPLTNDQLTLDTLPQDTSFGKRIYVASDGFWVQVNVVLMGSDRTSLHRTEYCMEGAGWHINRNLSKESAVRIEKPYPYDLPVMEFLLSGDLTLDGKKQKLSGVYIFWFVADNEYTASPSRRMWWMARDLARTGVLQRWACVSYFAACEPGREDATFERVKKLISASVPEFQLTPAPAAAKFTQRD